MSTPRHVLKESARIARGEVRPLSELTAKGDVQAVVFPGGFGAAKNLCDFGFKGADMKVKFMFFLGITHKIVFFCIC